ncbi:hypothetical protein ABIA33_002830 [Streptacidiphilus sp. MAP12-16]
MEVNFRLPGTTRTGRLMPVAFVLHGGASLAAVQVGMLRAPTLIRRSEVIRARAR